MPSIPVEIRLITAFKVEPDYRGTWENWFLYFRKGLAYLGSVRKTGSESVCKKATRALF